MRKERTLSVPAKLTIAALLATWTLPASAGTNDFFGTSVPEEAPRLGQAQAQTQAQNQAMQQQANPYADPTVPQGDFTTDEKRMQKKYKASIAHCKGLIAKAEKMMENGQRTKNDKDFKKGKILKEIGEKQLAELNANNPLADITLDSKSGNKAKTAATQSTTTQ